MGHRLKNIFTVVLIFTVLCLSLMPEQPLTLLYVSVGKFIGADPLWVTKNGWRISNYGHSLTSALITWLIVLRYSDNRIRIFALIFIFFAVIEFSQNFIPSRQASFSDFTFDLVGMFIGFIFAYTVKNWATVAQMSPGEEQD